MLSKIFFGFAVAFVTLATSIAGAQEPTHPMLDFEPLDDDAPLQAVIAGRRQHIHNDQRGAFFENEQTMSEVAIGLAFQPAPGYRFSIEPHFRETLTKGAEDLGPDLGRFHLNNDSYRLRLRGERRTGGFGFVGDAVVGYETYDLRRPYAPFALPLPGLPTLPAGVAEASSSGWFGEIEISASYDLLLHQHVLARPIATVRASRRTIQSAEETGPGPQNLRFDDIVQGEIETRLGGVVAIHDQRQAGAYFAGFAGGFWRHEFLGENFEPEATAVLNSAPIGPVPLAAGLEQDGVSALIGLTFKGRGGVEGLLYFERTHYPNAWSNALSARLLLPF